MEKEITRQDRIDKYLLGQMSPAENHDFECALNSDSELEDSVRLQRIILDELNQRATFEKMVAKVDEPRVISLYWKVLSIAAVFTGLIIVTFWQPWKMSNQTIVNLYAAVSHDKVQVDINVLSEVFTNERGIRGGFSTLDSVKVVMAIAQYENGNYQKTSSLLESIDILNNKDITLGFIMAVSELRSGEADKAISNFSYLSGKGYPAINQAISYYMALAYIQKDNLSKARELLRSIEIENAYYQKSQEILNRMRWF